MREGYYKEVQRIYHTQMSKIINLGGKVDDSEYQEVMKAEARAMYEQLPEMCLAEHGSHLGDVSDVFCKRCGVWIVEV